MSRNILVNWKKEFYVKSSPLTIKKQFERKNIDFIYETLVDFFGLDYFEMEIEEYYEENWIHYLLVNHSFGSFIALFEVSQTVMYQKTLAQSIQNKLKSEINDPRQLRSTFFELFIFQLLDYNSIENIKKPKEGNKELDLTCKVLDKEYLCECRKIYAPGVVFIENAKYILAYLVEKLKSSNKGFGIIGGIKFSNLNNIKNKKHFLEKIDRFILGFKEKKFNTIDYHDIDENGELSVISYNEITNTETENKVSQYHLVFKMIPPKEICSNRENLYNLEAHVNFSLSQQIVNRKLFSTIDNKVKQHSKSKYPNKIYFIDSETISDFSLPIFRSNEIFNENIIQKYVDDNLLENEVVCFIFREYIGSSPKLSIKALGKNINKKTKNKLESLKYWL